MGRWCPSQLSSPAGSSQKGQWMTGLCLCFSLAPGSVLWVQFCRAQGQTKSTLCKVQMPSLLSPFFRQATVASGGCIDSRKGTGLVHV